MSKLSSLVGKAKKYKIGDVELEIKPLTLKDLDKVLNISEGDAVVRSKAMVDLIRQTLKESEPEATEEEIDNVAFAHFQELSEAVIDVNGLKGIKNDASPTTITK